MKRISLIVALLTITATVFSQIPKGFNYQAVLRTADGLPISDQDVSVQITLTNNPETSTYYQEVHSKKTSSQGVVSLVIGNGTPIQSNLDNVPWKDGNIWIKVEVKKLGESTFTSMGLTQFQSVPYAQYAINGTWASEHQVVSSTTAGIDDPIFEVKNKDGIVVFGVYQEGVRINIADNLITKGTRGGFAVGGLTNQKVNAEYFRITPDSARVYIKEVPSTKGTRGGFAVGGLTNQKVTNNDYFNVSPNTTPTIINDNAQLLWYPLKEAFLVGRVQVLDPADVGLNSFSSGNHSKAKGNYSTAIGQYCLSSGSCSFAFGSNSQATNPYNVAIGNNSQATGSSNNYAFGNNAIASGSSDNYAIGSNTKIVEGFNSYAIGSNAEIYPLIYNGSGSTGSYAIGNYALVKGQRAYAIGDHARALNNDAIAIGTNAKATEYTAIAIGANGTNADTTYATGQGAIAFGYAAKSEGASSIALGTRSNAGNSNAIAFGYEANASGNGGVALGSGTIASANYAYAIGSGAVASGSNSIAIGSNANTNNCAGSVVISDNSGGLTATASNQFLVRASGGVEFLTNTSGTLATGVYISAGSGSWTATCDVNKKTNFKNENSEDYLNKLSNINIQSWNYKSQNPSIRHIGITAQDFYKNFQFGESDTTITEIDLSGVNMIAIKGLIERNAKLNQKVDEQKQKIEILEKEYTLLKNQLDELKNLVNSSAKK